MSMPAVGVPAYDAPHCAGPTHAGVFIVRRDGALPLRRRSSWSRHFVFNSIHSNSGMNLPRRVIAELAGSRPFFGSIVETHSQPINLERVARGVADATCVDCVTYAFFARYRPTVTEQAPYPGRDTAHAREPYVTATATGPAIKTALARALRRVATEPEWAPARAAMLLLDVVPPDQVDYQTPCRYADEAAALGYPRLH